MGGFTVKLFTKINFVLFLVYFSAASFIAFIIIDYSSKASLKSIIELQKSIQIKSHGLYEGQLSGIEFENHKFIIYQYLSQRQIIHHPSCPCLTKIEKE
jgi:hypothetical protein